MLKARCRGWCGADRAGKLNIVSVLNLAHADIYFYIIQLNLFKTFWSYNWILLPPSSCILHKPL